MSSILITGGSGFLGRRGLVPQVYNQYDRICIYSRNESKQAEMMREYPEYPDNKMRYFIGDVRDEDRLIQAMQGVDIVIHAAAQKMIESCQRDPAECMRTNIIGTDNVAKACLKAGVKKAIFISTDKAVEPNTLYGYSKGFAEGAWIQYNAFRSTKFSACRYANVTGSTSSILSIWKEQLDNNRLITVTDKTMTRMFLTVEQASNFVLNSLDRMEGGEIYIPKTNSQSIYVMAFNFVKNYFKENIEYSEIDGYIRFTGIRPGEKMHEILISESDARNCYDQDDVYCIYPSWHPWRKEYEKKGNLIDPSYRLSSKELLDYETNKIIQTYCNTF